MNKLNSDFIWLTNRCSVETIQSNKPSNMHTLNLLKNQIPNFEGKDSKILYNNILKEFSQRETFWKNKFDDNSFPCLVLDKKYDGLLIIVEKTPDYKYKCESSKGILYIDSFSDDATFKVLEAKEIDSRKISAIEMFKKVAYEQKRYILFALIASFSINILALGTSFFSMQVYDRVIPTNSLYTLLSLSIGVSIAILLEFFVKLSRSTILDSASKTMDIQYSHNIFERFLSVRCDQLPNSIGTISSQLQSYSNIRSFVSSAALYFFIDLPFVFLFIGVIILLGGPYMGGVCFLFLVLSLISGLYFKDKITELTKKSSDASHKKLGLLVETVESAEVIKTNSLMGKTLNKWNFLTRKAINDDMKIKHYTDFSTYLAAFFQQLSYVSLIALGAFLASNYNDITVGSLIAIAILSGRVLNPISTLPGLLVQFGRAKISITDIGRVFSLERDNEGVDRVIHPVLQDLIINCNDIKFSYDSERINLFIPKLEIKQGEKVAIVGGIGSGKSTMLKILSSIYKPQEGSILLNGFNMQHLSKDLVNSNIGYLSQNIKLISATLRENILMGNLNIDDHTILECSKKTGLIGLINSLPQGLDTQIPEGGNSFSGGQKQLIAITRIFITNPQIWILDEPTSHLDDTTEKALISTLQKHLDTTKTLILVTHKPLLLNLVDRIIVLANNQIVLDDKKEEVLRKITRKPEGKLQ